MKGRIEHDIKNENTVMRLIKNQPDYLLEYLNSFDGNKTSITKVNYIRNIIPFIDYLHEHKIINKNDINSFCNIKPKDINSYMVSIKYKNVNGVKVESKITSRAAKYYAVSNFTKYLLYNNYIQTNPCDKVSPPRITDVINVVSMEPEEINILKNNALNGMENETLREKKRREMWRNRDNAIISLGCATGLRVSSISEINIEDIEANENNNMWVINVTEKGNINRQCVIGKNTIEAISNWIKERNIIMGDNTGALFVTERKERISQRTIQRIIARYSADFHKHITPHKMRSSCATNLYNATGDIYLVQTVLGHSNIKNTRRYAKVEDEKLNNAASILDNMY